jgi:hypothetical protein
MGLWKGAEAILSGSVGRMHEGVPLEKNGRLYRRHGILGTRGMVHDVTVGVG